MLIASSVIRRVETLLREGRTQRSISSQVGVSRGVVSRVATGQLTSANREEYERSIADGPRPKTTIPATRCPKCGAACIEAPCRRCLTEALASPKPASLEEPPTLGVHLRPDDDVRYREIRQRADQEEEPDHAA